MRTSLSGSGPSARPARPLRFFESGVRIRRLGEPSIPELTQEKLATCKQSRCSTGYFSLNAGTLEIQIGDPTSLPPAKTLKSGDYIKVFEVDQSYVAASAAYPTCTCAPEHYTVTALSATGNTVVPLIAKQLDPANTTCAALTATSTEGCGSTVFVVP
jgi:hypothetical protein